MILCCCFDFLVMSLREDTINRLWLAREAPIKTTIDFNFI